MKSSILFEKSMLDNIAIFITSAYVYTCTFTRGLNSVNPSVSAVADSPHFMFELKMLLHPAERNKGHFG